jgi:hypothetical protein
MHDDFRGRLLAARGADAAAAILSSCLAAD